MMKFFRSVVAGVCLLAAAAGYAQTESAAGQNASPAPRWGAELKAGTFYPDVDDWSDFYGNDRGSSVGVTVSRALGPMLELAFDGAYFHDRGRGFYSANNRPGGDMLYELYTLGAGINIRLPVALWGWLTPYGGVSAVRSYYNELINGGDRRRGYRDGAMVRAGARILLDGVEPGAASVLQNDFGILNSLLVIEWQQSETDKVSGYDLGGESIYFGLRFEW